MSTDADLKRKLRAMLGTSVLAASLSSLPISFDLANLSFDTPQAHAKGGEGGDSGGGEGGDSGSGSGDSGEGGNSGSGSENSGSGSGDSGEGGNSGSGSDNSGSGSDNSGESGESGEGGNTGSSSGGESGRGKGKGGHSSGKSIPARFGHVVNSSRTSRGMEVQYSDGWSESIRSGRYYLKNPGRRTVISRRVRNSDYQRLRRALR